VTVGNIKFIYLLCVYCVACFTARKHSDSVDFWASNRSCIMWTDRFCVRKGFKSCFCSRVDCH